MQRTTIPGIITNKMDQDQIWAQLNKASISLQKSFKSGFKILNLKEKVNKIELEKEETPNYEEKPEKQSSFLDEEMNEEINIDNNENIEEESQNSMKNEHEPDDKVDFNDLEHFLEEAETKDVHY